MRQPIRNDARACLHDTRYGDDLVVTLRGKYYNIISNLTQKVIQNID